LRRHPASRQRSVSMATEVLLQQVAAAALEAGAVCKLGLHPTSRLT
jgi:hypothetical protein